MKITFLILIIIAATSIQLFYQGNTVVSEEGIVKAVITILEEQATAWNEGDIDKFMLGYLNSDSLRFASGGTITYGWQTTLDRYKLKYPDKETMEKLTFSDIDVNVISDDAAMVFGKWKLRREGDEPWGLFTLLFKNTNDGWRIIHDHTSVSDNK